MTSDGGETAEGSVAVTAAATIANTSQIIRPEQLTNLDEQPGTVIGQAMQFATNYYRNRNEDPEDIWLCFVEDFEGWEAAHFAKANHSELRDLRGILRRKGVYCKAERFHRIADSLYELVMSRTLPEWPIDQKTAPKTDPKTAIPSLKKLPLIDLAEGDTPNLTETKENQAKLSPRNNAAAQPQQDLASPAPIDIGRLMATLERGYSDIDKFSGKEYDFLRTKINLFVDRCRRINFPENELARALPTMLTGLASQYYVNNLANKGLSYQALCEALRRRYETEATRDRYLKEWDNLDLNRFVEKYPDKSLSTCLELLTEHIQKLHQGLFRPGDHGYDSMRDKLKHAAAKTPACTYALLKPAKTFEDLTAELQQAIAVHENMKTAKDDHSDTFYIDRSFRRGTESAPNYRDKAKFQGHRQRCYVCQKPGCWSTKHSDQERAQSRERWNKKDHPIPPSTRKYQAFLAAYEGEEYLSDEAFLAEFHQYHYSEEADKVDDEYLHSSGQNFFTTMGTLTQNFAANENPPSPNRVIADLRDAAFKHSLIGEDPFTMEAPADGTVFACEDRYSHHVFRGILPDTGASGDSNAGLPQARALIELMPSLKIEDAPETTINFGKGSAPSNSSITIPTIFGKIRFRVLLAHTPFLFSITDMDRLFVRLDNLTNRLIQGDLSVPVTRKWGHPWWLPSPEASVAFHLTETQLRQLHRRFGHPSVNRLSQILMKVGHEFDGDLLKHLTAICHHCQLNAKAPGRFKFAIKDDYEFNHEIIVDICHIDSQPVLHIVDTATSFQAARFLANKEQKAKDIWDAIMECWINTYLGPPEWIVHDAGRNFASAEFKQYAKGLYIRVQEVPVEAHNSIGKIERYHAPLRRAYQIIDAELGDTLTRDQKLQMAVKAINDSAGPNGLVPTLLVFGAYPRMTDDSPPSFNVVQRAEAIRKATYEARKLLSKRQIRDALNARNGPDTEPLHTLPLRSKVRVWRENKGWQGPYELIAIDGETCTVALRDGMTSQFRSVSVQPYYDDEGNNRAIEEPLNEAIGAQAPSEPEEEAIEDSITVNTMPPLGRRGRPRRQRVIDQTFFNYLNEPDRRSELFKSVMNEAFLSTKEKGDLEIALDLRQKGIITTPGQPFELSDQSEIDNLVARGVFEFQQIDVEKHAGIRIFNSRMVREVKGKGTDTPYEKSRLVICGYDDAGKAWILTQSPTIQRASQRLIIALAPSFIQQGMIVWIRDISQAYPQAQTDLQRTIIARIPPQIRDKYPPGTVMTVIKPLYGIPEAGTHWWATYSSHHREKLNMITSTYDPCLLITSSESFGIIGMQTDDTLGLSDQAFFDEEERELQKANFTAKPKEILTLEHPLTFNGCRIVLNTNGSITMTQKGQASKLQIPKNFQEYIEQRARGAYLATICQPEASFDLSVAAQQKEPSDNSFKRLGTRIQWQMDNQDRGLNYIPFDLKKAKIFVFVDGSFANNEDLSSQLGYIITIGTEEQTDQNQVAIRSNIIAYSSTKSKRVTRSALASELYSMVQGADIGHAITSTLKLVTTQLSTPEIPMILLTDSYSLYECLVKLGTTQEKRLMIDIMALRQSYERREAHEVRWINGEDNPADAMTKLSPNKALRNLIDRNEISVRMEGWVERKEEI